MQPHIDVNRIREKILITRACDTCRKKKIRCQPTSNSELCAQCIKNNSPCHFTPISVLKDRRRVSRDRRVEILEQRLAWMERQLIPPHEGQQSQRDLSSIDQDGQHVTSNITSQPQNLPVSGTLGLDMQRNFATGSETPMLQKLPPKEKARRLITSFFQGVNTVHPLFEQDTFMSKFNSAYGLDCNNDPGWWAALNVVLALAYQDWGMPDPDSQQDIEAWGYFQNALAATNQVITRHYTLASVQALLGLAMLMMAMPPHQWPVALLTSSAIKIAHSLGLHRQDQHDVLSSVETAERTRVFWIAYSIDREISLQTRQPPSQGEEDMDLEPPGEKEYGPVQPGGIRHDIFYFRTRLAIIQGQIYRQLLSVKAERQSASERAMAAEELEMTLQGWRRSVPFELLRDYSGPSLDTSSSENSHHPVYLQLLYFKTLALIHESLPVLPWYHEIQSSQVRIHIMSGRVTYPSEARSVMRLFIVTPRRKLACVWTTLHVFVTAATTLLVHAISNPSNHLVQTDLGLLEPFLLLLGVAAKTAEKDYKIEEMHQSSMILFEQARMAVEQSGQEVRAPRDMESKKENVEDFLERMERIRSGDNTGTSLEPRDIWAN